MPNSALRIISRFSAAMASAINTVMNGTGCVVAITFSAGRGAAAALHEAERVSGHHGHGQRVRVTVQHVERGVGVDCAPLQLGWQLHARSAQRGDGGSALPIGLGQPEENLPPGNLLQ